jgi:hypothetical protein
LRSPVEHHLQSGWLTQPPHDIAPSHDVADADADPSTDPADADDALAVSTVTEASGNDKCETGCVEPVVLVDDDDDDVPDDPDDDPDVPDVPDADTDVVDTVDTVDVGTGIDFGVGAAVWNHRVVVVVVVVARCKKLGSSL